uniref:Uncharacterized protein n=1 Tax=Panagrolaimus sp. ES5 TaxID=591445 RepID=A0AC34FNG0_9BILA
MSFHVQEYEKCVQLHQIDQSNVNADEKLEQMIKLFEIGVSKQVTVPMAEVENDFSMRQLDMEHVTKLQKEMPGDGSIMNRSPIIGYRQGEKVFIIDVAEYDENHIKFKNT